VYVCGGEDEVGETDQQAQALLVIPAPCKVAARVDGVLGCWLTRRLMACCQTSRSRGVSPELYEHSMCHNLILTGTPTHHRNRAHPSTEVDDLVHRPPLAGSVAFLTGLLPHTLPSSPGTTRRPRPLGKASWSVQSVTGTRPPATGRPLRQRALATQHTGTVLPYTLHCTVKLELLLLSREELQKRDKWSECTICQHQERR
jgi:hypothetical protein